MNTFDNAIKFCSNYPDENTPKNGTEYYFESSNIKSIAKEVDNEFKPNEFGAIFFFTRFQKVLIDGVYSNSNGLFVGFWYKNGGYRTCRLSEMRKINDPHVLLVGLV